MSQPASGQRRPIGRNVECDRLDEVAAAVMAGSSSTLVVRGEAGIGKTVLLDHFVQTASASGRVLRASGVESEMELPYAGLHPLLAQGDAAEVLYRQAIEHFDACRVAPFRHRARLVFGEWLRRERRRIEARDQLQAAYEGFTAMGANGFAERARRELVATGGTVPRQIERTRDLLTPQELQVVRLAAANTSNHDIATQLFISPSTVGYHLSKAFRKLDINSRRQLTDALASLHD